MNSSASRTLEKQKEQDEIRKQIQLLKAKLIETGEEEEEEECGGGEKESKKEESSDVVDKKKSVGGDVGGEEVMLAPNTPSPRKKRKLSQPHPSSSISKPSFHPRPIAKSSSSSSSTKLHPTSTELNPPTTLFSTPQPSTLFSSLRRLEKATEDEDDSNEGKGKVERTVGFEDKPRQQRDERLALVEDFEMGPYEFTPPMDDPAFKAFEPHSGIALSSRILLHADLSDYFVGRFYISPSKLYSLLRVDTSCTDTNKGKNSQKGGYDLEVPVPGDWVTIAVIAERGPIKYTKAPVGVEKDEEDVKTKKRWEGKGKKDKPAPAEEEGGGRGGGKKYVTLKMIDFGARSQTSGGGGYRQIRGDAFLNLILFEADGFDLISRDNEGMGGRRRRDDKVYRGGSGGAFEKLMDVREGDVVALLNPKVLRPFQRTNASSQTPILAVTPPSASSIVIIGRSRDLGMCTVLKADGKVCGAWCDKRAVAGSKEEKGSVCEYHLERAVMRRRAGRNEFAIGTSGMTTSATHKRKHDYDPNRKWGLKPLNDSGSAASTGASSGSGGALGATYVFGGHVVSNSNVAASSMFVGETIGREAQARARRKMGDGKVKEKEDVLVSRMARSGRGGRVSEKGKVKGKVKVVDEEEDEDEDDDSCSEGKDKKEGEKKNKPLYSAEFIKSVGFDPSLKAGIGIVGNPGSAVSKSVQDKLDALRALQRSRTKGIELGPRPGGPRIRSGVVAPPATASDSGKAMDVNGKAENGKSEGGEEKMVDLDDM